MAVQSKERLNELLEKYRLTGDMNVRNEIVLMYMDLVKMIAVSMRNIYTGYAESDDIINEGVSGYRRLRSREECKIRNIRRYQDKGRCY